MILLKLNPLSSFRNNTELSLEHYELLLGVCSLLSSSIEDHEWHHSLLCTRIFLSCVPNIHLSSLIFNISLSTINIFSLVAHPISPSDVPRKSDFSAIETHWQSSIAAHSGSTRFPLLLQPNFQSCRDVHAQEKFVLYAHAPALTCTHGNTHTTALWGMISGTRWSSRMHSNWGILLHLHSTLN